MLIQNAIHDCQNLKKMFSSIIEREPDYIQLYEIYKEVALITNKLKTLVKSYNLNTGDNINISNLNLNEKEL